MKLYNTLTRTIEEFIPREEGKVKLYTCGPTVYSYAHIGNIRNYIGHDILDKTCLCHLRDNFTNVNQWLMRYWQLGKNEFEGDYIRNKNIKD